MVFRDFIVSDLLRKKISKLLPRVQIPSFKAKPSLETLKSLRGLTFLFLSILGAWISIQLTSEQSVNSYQNSHWPPEFIWRQMLTAKGYSQKQKLGEYSKLLESNPNAFSNEPKIWVTEDSGAVYLPASPYHPNGSELWTGDDEPKIGAWVYLGTGLRGFEKLISFFENAPKIARQNKVKRAKSIDPKEFHY